MSADALTRRSALRGGAVAVAAGVVGYVVARNSSAAKPKGITTAANGYGAGQAKTGKLLVPVNSVPVGGGVILRSAGVVVTRDSTGGVHGFSATCTHQGCTVVSVSGGTINCPCHGSRFNVANGAVVGGPAPRPLPPVAVVVQGANVYTG
jgi:Rieske Fe-S protein